MAAPRHSERGMTLIEVLMVMFIIGLASGLVVMTLPQRPSTEQASAQAFVRTLEQLQDQAILSGQPVGLELADDRYNVLAWQNGRWQDVPGGATLPDRLEITRRDPFVRPAETWPHIVFDPTGVNETAEFTLRGSGSRIEITLSEGGEVSLVER